ncbi:MAG TPA: ferritin-like domain-containing protein [Gammaproteobacteria bacterium]
MNKEKVIDTLNRILELELAGVVRNMHYSLMVFGHSRIPIVEWFREESNESLVHAAQAGEYITSLGGHPSLKIGDLLETHKHDINAMLNEAMEHEKSGISLYRELLGLVEGEDIRLEEYAREMIRSEEDHLDVIEKMLCAPQSS